jgi:SAM-dependent methyltransferase
MRSVTRVLHRAVGRATVPARRRGALGSFLLDSTSPLDVLLTRLYFALDARVWSETQDGAVRTAPVQAGFDALTRTPRDVIELGCGAGGAAVSAAERWPEAQVNGYDASRQMIRHAKRLAHNPNVSFARRQAERVHGQADLVLLLNYVVYPGRAKALLRPGGELLVADSFHHASPATRPHWESFGFEWVAGADVADGFYELYRVPA